MSLPQHQFSTSIPIWSLLASRHPRFSLRRHGTARNWGNSSCAMMTCRAPASSAGPRTASSRRRGRRGCCQTPALALAPTGTGPAQTHARHATARAAAHPPAGSGNQAASERIASAHRAGSDCPSNTLSLPSHWPGAAHSTRWLTGGMPLSGGMLLASCDATSSP